MPPTDKPMLTKQDVEVLRDYWQQSVNKDAALNTIEAFAELLQWHQDRWDGTGKGACNDRDCGVTGVCLRCEHKREEVRELLAAYHGTGTSEQEGGGK